MHVLVRIEGGGVESGVLGRGLRVGKRHRRVRGVEAGRIRHGKRGIARK